MQESAVPISSLAAFSYPIGTQSIVVKVWEAASWHCSRWLVTVQSSETPDEPLGSAADTKIPMKVAVEQELRKAGNSALRFRKERLKFLWSKSQGKDKSIHSRASDDASSA
jgi:hypothetical protein